MLMESIGKTFVNGLAMEYLDGGAYDEFSLKGHISEKDFSRIFTQINDTLYSYFPCPLCFCFGYCCCPCTLGLSFCLPYICIRDAEKEARVMIEKFNEEILNSKGLDLQLKRECCTSWVSVLKNLTLLTCLDGV